MTVSKTGPPGRPVLSAGAVQITADIHRALDRVSWNLKLHRPFSQLSISDCLAASVEEVRRCAEDLALVTWKLFSAIFISGTIDSVYYYQGSVGHWLAITC